MKSITMTHTYYKDIHTEQTANCVDYLFPRLLMDIKPNKVIEIGTGNGGLTHLISDTLPDSEIISFDVNNKTKKILPNVIYYNLDAHSIDVVNNIILPFINGDDTVFVICDGPGLMKIAEFNLYSKLIKKGDYISVHDYCIDIETYERQYKNKIWNGCKVFEKDLIETSNEIRLMKRFNYMDEDVWIVKQKLSNLRPQITKHLI